MPGMLAISKHTQIAEHIGLTVDQAQEVSLSSTKRAIDQEMQTHRARYGPLLSDPTIGGS
jgi:hypothetical protein